MDDINLDDDVPTPKVTKKEPRVIKKFPPKAQPVPQQEVIKLNTILKEDNEDKIKRLLDELFTCSLNERRKKIISKYQKEMSIFEESLGTEAFERALGEFFREKIEGKILAAYHSED